MCYNVSTPELKKLNAFALQNTLVVEMDYKPYFNVSGFDRPYLPVTLNSKPDIIQEARWKLIPFWVKTEEEAKRYSNTLNARSEDVFQSSSYKNYITGNRGLLYLDGFYEPHASNGLKNDQTFYFHRPGKEIFTLGVVYSPWENRETGELTNTFSILTVPANKMTEEIHNVGKRMILYIAPEDREGWLNADSKEEIQSYFNPAPEDTFEAYRTQMILSAMKGPDSNIPNTQMPFGDGYGLEGTLFS